MQDETKFKTNYKGLYFKSVTLFLFQFNKQNHEKNNLKIRNRISIITKYHFIMFMLKPWLELSKALRLRTDDKRVYQKTSSWAG